MGNSNRRITTNVTMLTCVKQLFVNLQQKKRKESELAKSSHARLMITLSVIINKTPAAPEIFWSNQVRSTARSSGHKTTFAVKVSLIQEEGLLRTSRSFRSWRNGITFGPRSLVTTTLGRIIQLPRTRRSFPGWLGNSNCKFINCPTCRQRDE